MLDDGANPTQGFNQDVMGNANEICPNDALFVLAEIISELSCFSCNLEKVACKLTSNVTANESKFMYEAGFLVDKSDTLTNPTDIPPIAMCLGVCIVCKSPIPKREYGELDAF